MTDLIERMARAFIKAATLDDCWTDAADENTKLSDVVIDGHVDLIAGMKAAIEAMREPAPEMLSSGVRATRDEGGSLNDWCGASGEQVKASWIAMIDHALSQD